MAKKQSALQEETVKLRKKIEKKKFKMLYLRKNERTRTIERG